MGNILPDDEIAVLAEELKADGAAHAHAEDPSLADQLDGLGITMLHDPGHPETFKYGRRLTQYAGIITDNVQLALLTDVVIAVGQAFGLRFEEIHNDSTTVSFCGAYRNAWGRKIRGRGCVMQDLT